MTAAVATATPKRVRRVPLAGEVNITNDAEARAALDTFRAQKVRESDGAAAKRERTAPGGSEAILRDRLGENGTVLVVNGQPVAKVSSVRHSVKVDLETLQTLFPEAYAAVVTREPYTFIQAS